MLEKPESNILLPVFSYSFVDQRPFVTVPCLRKYFSDLTWVITLLFCPSARQYFILKNPNNFNKQRVQVDEQVILTHFGSF